MIGCGSLNALGVTQIGVARRLWREDASNGGAPELVEMRRDFAVGRQPSPS